MAKKKDLTEAMKRRRIPQVLQEAQAAGELEAAVRDGMTASRYDGITEKRNDGKTAEREAVKTARWKDGATAGSRDKPLKLTVFLEPELWKKWKEHETAQVLDGRRVSFQGTVERLLRDYLSKKGD